VQWFYRYFLPKNPTEELLSDPLLSPIKAKSLADLPPALVVPAQVDVLRDEGIAYARRLAEENDSWTQLWLAQGVPHPFPHQVKAHPTAVAFRNLAVQRLSEAFAGQLKGKEFISNI
jgi:acetyl esterase/lipase